MGFFAAGVLFFLARRFVPVSGRLAFASWVVLFLVRDTLLWAVCWPLGLAYLCLWFGYSDRFRAHGFARFGDFSYGICIFAFPIQQALYAAEPSMAPLWNFGCALACALVLAVGSWHLVEKRALALKSPLARAIDALLDRRSHRASLTEGADSAR